jgi:hypothetical protein
MGSLSSQLVEREIATMKQVEEALARQVLYGGDLATNLLEVLGGEREGALTYVLAEHYALRPAKTGELPRAPESVLKLVPADTAGRHGLCPLGMEGGSLLVAVSEPLPTEVEDQLSFALGMPIVQLAAPLVRVRQALARDYKLPLDRRQLRLIAKLEGFPDPMPSSMPPAMPGGAGPSFRAPKFPKPFGFSEEIETKPGVGTDRPPPPDAPLGYVPTPARRLIRWMQRTAQAHAQKRMRRRRGPMTIGQAEEALSAADSAEEALSVFFDFAQQFFAYSALFVVHGDLAEGRDSYGPGATREQVTGIGVALDLPSCLSLAKGRLAPVCMTLPKDGLDAALAKDLGRAPTAAIVVVPVTVRRRCVALVYGDDAESPVELEQVGDVVAAASLTANRLEKLVTLRKRKKDAASIAPPARAMTSPGIPIPEPPMPDETTRREKKAVALVRALGLEDERPGASVPGDVPGRKITERFGAVEPPRAEPAVEAPPPSGPSLEVGESALEDELLAATLDEIESVPSSQPPPSSKQPATDPAPELLPMSRSSYHPPRQPPMSARHQSILPSIIVDVGVEQSRVVERLIAGDEDEEALGEALRQGVTVVPAILSRLPGPLRASREQLLSGEVRPHAAGPLFRALVALRRTALPFVAVHSANLDRDPRMYATLVLGELAYPEAAQAILSRLFDPDEDVRRAALAAARMQRSSSEVFGLLLSSIERIVRASSEQPMRRVQAALALGELATPGCVPTLLAALETGSHELHHASRVALSHLTLRDLGDDVAPWDVWWRRHGAEDRAVWVIDALTSEHDELRSRAVGELRTVVPFDLSAFESLAPVDRSALQDKVRAWWQAGLGDGRGRALESEENHGRRRTTQEVPQGHRDRGEGARVHRAPRPDFFAPRLHAPRRSVWAAVSTAVGVEPAHLVAPGGSGVSPAGVAVAQLDARRAALAAAGTGVGAVDPAHLFAADAGRLGARRSLDHRSAGGRLQARPGAAAAGDRRAAAGARAQRPDDEALGGSRRRGRLEQARLRADRRRGDRRWRVLRVPWLGAADRPGRAARSERAGQGRAAPERRRHGQRTCASGARSVGGRHRLARHHAVRGGVRVRASPRRRRAQGRQGQGQGQGQRPSARFGRTGGLGGDAPSERLGR